MLILILLENAKKKFLEASMLLGILHIIFYNGFYPFCNLVYLFCHLKLSIYCLFSWFCSVEILLLLLILVLSKIPFSKIDSFRLWLVLWYRDLFDGSFDMKCVTNYYIAYFNCSDLL
jgi:hypothetical protein